MHYIRNVVIEQIVLDNLKEIIGYVSAYENEFVQLVMETDVRQRNKDLAKHKNGWWKSKQGQRNWIICFSVSMRII
ncbi:hypothetical protein RBQ61_05035 [Sedimentibacter sp. MB35-C1]|uniref:hypothetical protein n=1 Tax=Sedimentibacter sp. MB35-C1 TaxID=3070995 RepID=UPI0027E03171|nr:hypothetical protein [Sedimentibacter sp. MB35-C1]WMJ78299.1 hypothetical protein RBQ61_05035 [Sedimentibacter sp. MB35-C1]